jgi:hypothetical protein
MRDVARLGVLLLCFSTLFNLPTSGAHRRVLGVVSQTDRAHLDSQNAVVGADIYSCDSLDTEDGGAMRVQIGSSQVYLATASAAQLEDDLNEIQVLITSGTVGFSEPASGNISIRTPAGLVRPSQRFGDGRGSDIQGTEGNCDFGHAREPHSGQRRRTSHDSGRKVCGCHFRGQPGTRLP